MTDPRLRRAVRAIVLDPDPRILLVRFELSRDGAPFLIWAAPGGGIEAGEDERAALHRELAEETGLDAPAIGPCVWTRTHWFPMPDHDGQHERFYLVHTDAFVPTPLLTDEQLRAESVTGMRWWTPDEVEASTENFAPSRLAALLSPLVAGEVPESPIDVGV